MATINSINQSEALPVPVTVPKGGTGLVTLTDKNIIVGAGVGNVAFLAPGTFGNVLTSDGTNWASTTQLQYYGIQFDITASDPAVTRIGNMWYHATLPIQSLMAGCLLNDDGTVNYYLNAADWTKKSSGDASNLDGTDGQVMVEIPTFYYLTSLVGNTYEYRMSLIPLVGYTRVQKHYVAAYEGVINRTPTIKLWSIINAATEYRGGNNNAAYDAQTNTFLGRPATLISRTDFRTYADNRGTKWSLQTGEQYSAIVWLFVMEYATRNSQDAVNAVLTTSGYHQGALGNGVTTAVSGEWNAFNGYYPFVPCGASNTLGNGSGEVNYVAADFGGAGVSRTFTVNRYRGIEMPFGHIWKWLDGINILHNNVGDGGTSIIYQRNTKTFVDGTLANYVNAGNLPLTSDYVKLMQDSGLIMPKTVGSSNATWWCDYFYTPQPVAVTAWYAPIVGGHSLSALIAGFGYVLSYTAASDTFTSIGGRLSCFGI